jgi:acetoin utilization protein AcuC
VVPRLAVVWDDRFLDYDFGPGHPFTEASRKLGVDLLASLVRRDRPGPIVWVDRIDPAARDLLETFHAPEYLRFVERLSGERLGSFLDRGDTPSFPGCYSAAARLVAGAARAEEISTERGIPSFHPAGGLHHAHPDGASGFCIFNDVAIVISRALRDRRRVAYLDIDAHHGDGVMYGFYRSGQVLDIDFHQDGRTLFPGTGYARETGRGDGAGLKVNVPLPPGAGDEALVPLFRRLVPALVREFKPDVIVLQHGVDGHAEDALAQLQYTPAAYLEIDRLVLDLSREVCGGRLLVTGGGGYRAASVSRVLARVGAILSGVALPADGDETPRAWREEFRQRVGESAPAVWSEPPALSPSPWRPSDASELLRELESHLGRRFPGES